jgi:hypothetical protein
MLALTVTPLTEIVQENILDALAAFVISGGVIVVAAIAATLGFYFVKKMVQVIRKFFGV